MRPNTRSTRVESTLTGEDVAMTIDDDSMEHIMGLLTDLYADPERAIIREYATNAWDAHIEAGEDRPIEIELPTSLRHVLVVRDHGPGLSREDVRAIYSRYGASTKRGTNDATGMLGLGCKSALTYTDQFTVTAVKDGQRIAVAVSRDERGRGHMTVLDESETDEPSGVEISIPVKRDHELAEKAREFFAYWPKGSVLLDGGEPEHVRDREGYIPIGENIIARPARVQSAVGRHSEAQDDLIIQGGVSYSVDFGIDGVSLIAWVPIGSVDFAPSREAVMDTKHTRAAVAAVATNYAANVDAAVQALIDEAESRDEALTAWMKARWLGTDAAPRWDGEDVPTDFGHGDGTRLWLLGSVYHRSWRGGTRGRGAHDTLKAITIEQAGRAYWVTGFTNSTWSATMRDKLDGFVADRFGEDAESTDGTILTPKDVPPHAAWIDPSRVFTWEDVRAFKLPAASTPAGLGYGGARRVAGTYRVFLGKDCTERLRSTSKHPADDLRKDSTPLFYAEAGAYEGATEAHMLRSACGEAWNLAVVPGNRLAKFLRTFPKAKPWRKGCEAAAKRWWDGLDDDEQALLTWEPTAAEIEAASHGIDPDALDDAALAARLKLVGRKNGLDGHAAKWQALNRYIDPDARRQACERTDSDTVIANYPVLTYLAYIPSSQADKITEHLTLYANAVYAAAQQ